MTYVLVIMLMVSQGVSVTTQEFNSKALCEAARLAVIETHTEGLGGWGDVATTCVPKGV